MWFGKLRYKLRKSFGGLLKQVPVHELQHDGKIQIKWENPYDRDSRAFDHEHASDHLFLEGYSNALRLSIEDVESGEVELIPSGRYKQYMEQKVISDVLRGVRMGALGQKTFYLSVGTIIAVGIVIVMIAAQMGG